MAKEEFLIKHEESQYDIADFLKNHPGGFNYVEGFRNKDIASKMTNSEHSKSAFYLLREYKVGGRDENNVQGDEDLEVSYVINLNILFSYLFMKG